MCLDDSCTYRAEQSNPQQTGNIIDELDNQVITKGENSDQEGDTQPEPVEDSIEAEEKRKQIGDEFYRESSEEIEEGDKVVKLTGSLIAVTSEALNISGDSIETGDTGDTAIISFPVPVVTSVIKPQLCTVVETATLATQHYISESELQQKLQEQILSDHEGSSNSSPPHSVSPGSGPSHHQIAVLSHNPENGLSNIFQEDLSSSGQQPEPQGKIKYNCKESTRLNR